MISLLIIELAPAGCGVSEQRSLRSSARVVWVSRKVVNLPPQPHEARRLEVDRAGGRTALAGVTKAPIPPAEGGRAVLHRTWRRSRTV